MTSEERNALVEHRLKALEEIAKGARVIERDVDLLKIGLTRIEAEQAAQRAEAAAAAEHSSKSIARIHDKLDAIKTQDDKDAGAREERRKLVSAAGKWFVAAAGVASGIGGLIVAIAH